LEKGHGVGTLEDQMVVVGEHGIKNIKNLLLASAQSFSKCFYIEVHKLDTQSRNKANRVRKISTTEKNEIFCPHSFELPQKNQCTMIIASWHPIYTRIRF